MSATTTVVLTIAYAAALSVGLMTLRTSGEPIQGPIFSIMEILIIALAPTMVALMVAVHSWTPAERKALSLASLVFMGLLAGVTTSLHFSILTLSHNGAFAQQSWADLVFSFNWPSVAYALDIVAWDFFFALSALFAAGALWHLATIRWLLIVSGVVALAGLWGAALGDMHLRNVGIIGYVVVFPTAAVLMGNSMYRTRVL